MPTPAEGTRSYSPVQVAGLFLGPVLAACVYLLLPAGTYDDAGELTNSGLSHAARATGAIGVLMACWWLTEAIPISATALLPAALFPALGVMPLSVVGGRYAHEMIMLFFAGFILGLAMERHGLHKRIALTVVGLIGTSPGRLVAGFMLATAAMSGWVSNTATALMMLPIGVSVISLVLDGGDDSGESQTGRNFATCLMLGIAYAASIGGVVTIIGTPPNLVLAGFAQDNLGLEISMVRWMTVALPLALVFLPLCWLVLTRVVFPIRVKRIEGVEDRLNHVRAGLGRMKRGEWIVFVVFCCTALAWVLRPQIQRLGEHLGLEPIASLGDATIGVIAATLLFVIPCDTRPWRFTMDWKTAERMPWGILILFGGGLALAKAISDTGVDTFIGSQLGVLEGVHPAVIVVAVTAVIVFLTEITSNTAIANAVLPVLAAAAPAVGIDPIRLLVPATIACSLAFMLPVATPPNAIIFGSGRVTIGQMSRAGLWLNLIGIVLGSVAGYFFAGYVVTPAGV